MRIVTYSAAVSSWFWAIFTQSISQDRPDRVAEPREKEKRGRRGRNFREKFQKPGLVGSNGDTLVSPLDACPYPRCRTTPRCSPPAAHVSMSSVSTRKVLPESGTSPQELLQPHATSRWPNHLPDSTRPSEPIFLIDNNGHIGRHTRK